MHLGIIVVLLYIIGIERKISRSKLLEVMIYFIVIATLSYISIYYFPLSSDEILYNLCRADLDPKSPILQCPDYSHNQFVQFTKLVFFIGGGSAFSLLSIGYAFIYISCDLISRTFTEDVRLREKVFRITLFFPPVLYFGLRPKKEAVIVLLVSLVSFFISKPKSIQRVVLLIPTLIGLYLMRWQFMVGALFSIGVFFAIKYLLTVSRRKLYGLLAASVLASTLLGYFFKDPVLKKLNDTIFYYNNVTILAYTTNGALIYRFMMFDVGETTLQPWNVFVAQIGGIITPHPLRVIKEYQRDGEIKYHVLEEFLYITSWFFLLMPVFFLFLKDKIFMSFKNARETFVFQTIFSFTILGLASMSLLYHTPQHFRYRLPMHLFFFMAIIFYLSEKNSQEILDRLKQEWIRISFYFVILTIYSVAYLGIEPT